MIKNCSIFIESLLASDRVPGLQVVKNKNRETGIESAAFLRTNFGGNAQKKFPENNKLRRRSVNKYVLCFFLV